MNFKNTYFKLGKAFYQNVLPEKVYSPSLLFFNTPLANTLSIAESLQSNSQQLANYFSGNSLLEGSQSIALAYSGHQFGHFNPQLGDGRAHLLGEVFDNTNTLRDIQLKGSGRTAFSRQGDGRCALGPAIREYLMSEALFALGVPTSRCLAIVSTGETIYRGTAKAGAVVTRVASSHIRVGTFQYFASRKDMVSLLSLTDYAIQRHFAHIDEAEDQNIETRVLSFLEAVISKQLTLVINWLRVGFIHGVMNTDNTPICGETLDFGPCAMMNRYESSTVFSSIDRNGRYAFDQQGDITLWNMSRLAECLLMLLMHETNKNQEELLIKIEPILIQFNNDFKQASDEMYASKLGFSSARPASISLTQSLLELMTENKLDYTNTYLMLNKLMAQSLEGASPADSIKLIKVPEVLIQWHSQWQEALSDVHRNGSASLDSMGEVLARMNRSNPVIIPRNNQVEHLLTICETASEQGDASVGIKAVNDYLEALKTPYSENDKTAKYAYSPEAGDDFYQTFCGT